MEIEDIRNLMKWMGEYNLTEVSMQAEGCNLCLKRGGNAPAAVIPAAVVAAPAAAPAPAPVPEAAPSPAPVAVEAEKTIDSPLVGIFYRAATPEAQPFVKEGDTVSPDTTVCIIEAMKVMNEVKAEKSGVIKKILMENGQSVEYGTPMFVIA